MTRQLLLFLVGALLGSAYGYFLRDYPLPLAAVLGAAVGTLLWAIQRTVDRLRGPE